MKSWETRFGLPIALFATLLFAACQNTARGVEQDTKENTAAAREAGQDASAATKEALGDASQNTKEAAGSVGDAIDGAKQTMDIKTALVAEKSVDATGINVDTDGTTKTVTLKGHVPTLAQKAEAERIATDKAPGYRIVNDLVVQ